MDDAVPFTVIHSNEELKAKALFVVPLQLVSKVLLHPIVCRGSLFTLSPSTIRKGFTVAVEYESYHANDTATCIARRIAGRVREYQTMQHMRDQQKQKTVAKQQQDEQQMVTPIKKNTRQRPPDPSPSGPLSSLDPPFILRRRGVDSSPGDAKKRSGLPSSVSCLATQSPERNVNRIQSDSTTSSQHPISLGRRSTGSSARITKRIIEQQFQNNSISPKILGSIASSAPTRERITRIRYVRQDSTPVSPESGIPPPLSVSNEKVTPAEPQNESVAPLAVLSSGVPRSHSSGRAARKVKNRLHDYRPALATTPVKPATPTSVLLSTPPPSPGRRRNTRLQHMARRRSKADPAITSYQKCPTTPPPRHPHPHDAIMFHQLSPLSMSSMIVPPAPSESEAALVRIEI